MEIKSAVQTEMVHTSVEHVESPCGELEAKISPQGLSEVATNYSDFMVENSQLS